MLKERMKITKKGYMNKKERKEEC